MQIVLITLRNLIELTAIFEITIMIITIMITILIHLFTDEIAIIIKDGFSEAFFMCLLPRLLILYCFYLVFLSFLDTITKWFFAFFNVLGFFYLLSF